MYSIHLVTTLHKNVVRNMLVDAWHSRHPLYVTVSETPEGQFFVVHAGLFTCTESARLALSATPHLQRVAPSATVRVLPADTIPYSQSGTLFAAQLMALRNLDSALDTIRSLARQGLGPVLHYAQRSDGNVWAVVLCSLTPNRAAAQERVRNLGRRTQWNPIVATFP